MAVQRCPNCGAEVPEETGQHALTPSAGVVTCPNCGATVTLDKPGAEPEESRAPASDVPTATEGGWGEEVEEESFSGHETIEGVMEEIEEKEGGER
jgi:uncharacterized Zn finger protein (UPF0148 family)